MSTGIQVKLKGKARVRWTEQMSHNIDQGSNSDENTGGQCSQAAEFEGREDYFEYKFYVFGSGNEALIILS